MLHLCDNNADMRRAKLTLKWMCAAVVAATGPIGCESSTGPDNLDASACAASDASDPIAFLAEAPGASADRQARQGAFHDNLLFVCTEAEGLVVYRTEGACGLTQLQRVLPDPEARANGCRHVIVQDERLYVTHRGDDLQPRSFVTAFSIREDGVDRLETFFAEAGIAFEGLSATDDALYVAQHEAGLAVFSWDAEGRPVFSRNVVDGLVNAWRPALGSGNDTLYVADGQGGIAVFDVSAPLMPRRIGRAPTQGTMTDLTVHEDQVFGAAGIVGVEVFDVSSPASIRRQRRVDTPTEALRIAVSDGMMAVADRRDVQLFRLDASTNVDRFAHQLPYANAQPNMRGRVTDALWKDGTLYLIDASGPQAHRVQKNLDAPDIWVPATLELFQNPEGGDILSALYIDNAGRVPLSLASVTMPPPFSLRTINDQVPPGRSALVEIVYPSSTDAPVNAELVIASDDPDQPTLTIEVKANLPGLRIGETAPEALRFKDLGGFAHQMGDLRGQPVLLAYFATF